MKKRLMLLYLLPIFLFFTLSFVVTSMASSQISEEWVARYNGPADDEEFAWAIAVDASGNVYVTGGSWTSETAWDYATVKYDTDGNQLWVARYNGTANDWDSAWAIAVDASGNVYVTGGSPGSGTSFDYTTVKYDTDGSEQWVARYDGPANSIDEAYAMAVDASGNIYVTGYSFGNGTDIDYATVKYTPDSDGDGITDIQDSCPEEDASGFDADSDGCIDTISGLDELLQTLVTEGLIEKKMLTSLSAKIKNAEKSFYKDNICAAVNQLEAFINQVNAQRGGKFSPIPW